MNNMFFFFFIEENLKKFAKDMFQYAGYQIIEDDETQMDDSNYKFFICKEEDLYKVQIRQKMTPNFIAKLEKETEQRNNQKYQSLYLVFDYIDEEKKERLNRKYNITLLDISNIIYIIKDDEELMKKLKELLDYSISGIEKKEPGLDVNIIKRKTEKIDYKRRLQQIKPGQEQWTEFQQFCVDFVKEVFSDDLDSWGIQEETENKTHRFDLIARIKYRKEEYNDFFKTVENFFNTKYLIFEFKNYTENISEDEILNTAKYLYEKALRKVAIIFTRKGMDKGAKKAIRALCREQGKVILILEDKDINNMIKLWGSNEASPAIILQEKLNDFLIHLEK